MARRLRIQYSDAIYHVMARGNGRQDIVQDDADRGRLVACLERAVRRSGWSLYAFVFLPITSTWSSRRLAPTSPRECNCSSRRTPMGGLVATAIAGTSSRAATGPSWSRTKRISGSLTRYVHLNPVAAGLTTPPSPPWAEARHGWFLGSERFLDRLRHRLGDQAHRDLRRERRLLRGLDLARVIEAVCSRYGVDRGQLATRGSRSPARAALAYLAKHHTEATRAELVPILGLSRPESVPNPSARFAALLQSESNARRDLMALERDLGLSGENSKSV